MQVRNISQVATAVAEGDLSQEITVDAQGEVLQLKQTFNTMVRQLSAFADEVTRVAREVGTEGRLGGQAHVRGVSGIWKDLTENVNSTAGRGCGGEAGLRGVSATALPAPRSHRRWHRSAHAGRAAARPRRHRGQPPGPQPAGSPHARAARRPRPPSSRSCARCARPTPRPRWAWSSGRTSSPSGPTRVRCAVAATRTSPIRWRSPGILADLGMDAPTLAAALLHDTVEDTEVGLERHHAPVRRAGRDHRRRRHQARPGQDPRPRRRGRSRPGGAERDDPQDGRRDGARPAGAGRQARRPAAQHAHPALPAAAQAGAQGPRDAGDLRAAGPPAGHEHRQVGARGPRVRDPVPEALRGDRPARQRAPAEPRHLPGDRDGAGRPTSCATRRSSRRSAAGRSTTTRSTRR